MGEASRRKALGNYPSRTAGADLATRKPPKVLTDVVAQSLDALNRIDLETTDDSTVDAGTVARQCWWRNYMVPMAAQRAGLRARPVVGGMLYVAGRGETDLVVFGDIDVRPQMPGLFHVWAEVKADGVNWLIDITPPHWPSLPGAAGTDHLPPIHWQATPPQAIIAPRNLFPSTFKGLRRGTPPGAIWYGNERRHLQDQVLGQIAIQRAAFATALALRPAA